MRHLSSAELQDSSPERSMTAAVASPVDASPLNALDSDLPTPGAELRRDHIENDLSFNYLKTLEGKKEKDLRILIDHIKDVAIGRSGSDGYDPDRTTQEQRIQLKVSQLHHSEQRMSRATLMRKVRAYRHQGTSGLVDRRATRTYRTLPRVDDRVREAISDAVIEYSTGPTRTRSFLIHKAKANLYKTYGINMPTLPSEASLYRAVNKEMMNYNIALSAKTRVSQSKVPNRTLASYSVKSPGGETQIDSTPLDVLVKGAEKDTYVRPILTILVDRATRSILAYTFRLDGAKAIDHIALLAQSLIPVSERPDRADWRERVARENPTLTWLSDAERAQHQAERAYIAPRRIMMDNGKDFVSLAFLSATEKLGIDVTFSAPHTPTDKPVVERTFGSINTLFTQYLPAYVGRSPEHRGIVNEKEALSIQAVAELFDDWVNRDWQNRKHSGLRSEVTSETFSPNEMHARLAGSVSEVFRPLTRGDYINLLPVEHRLITKTGVQNGNRHYDSVELHPYRNTRTDDVAHGRKWTIAVDPYDELVIWVKAPDNTWIECHTRDRKGALTPNFEAGALTTDRTTLAAEHGIGAHALPYAMTPEWTDEDDPADPTEVATEHESVHPEKGADAAEETDIDDTQTNTNHTSSYGHFNADEED